MLIDKVYIMDFSYLDDLNGAYAESRILHAAVELNIFDTINDQLMSAKDISAILNTDERATTLLLNALSALNLLHKHDNLFSLTLISKKYLLSGSETCYVSMIRFDASMWDVWGRLSQAVRTGKPVRTPDMYQTNKEDTDCFIMAMHQLVSVRGDAGLLAERLNLERVRSILDIGSGPGTYPIAICRKYTHISATIFDLPGTLEITRQVLKKEGLDNRINVIAGDYNHDTLPQGFDMVFLSNIIHGEDEETNRSLMKKIYSALNPYGRIVIKDHIMDESLTKPACGAIFSINMLLTTNGRDYGYHEIQEWLETAGFYEITLEMLPAPMTSSLVTGKTYQ